MTPHFLKWSFGPKIESVDGICQQTDSRNRFYLDVKTGPYTIRVYGLEHKKRRNIVIGEEKYIYVLQQVRKDFPLRVR